MGIHHRPAIQKVMPGSNVTKDAASGMALSGEGGAKRSVTPDTSVLHNSNIALSASGGQKQPSSVGQKSGPNPTQGGLPVPMFKPLNPQAQAGSIFRTPEMAPQDRPLASSSPGTQSLAGSYPPSGIEGSGS